MELKNADALMEAYRRAESLSQQDYRAAIRHWAAAIEGLQVHLHSDGRWWIANCHDHRKTYLLPLPTADRGKEIEKGLVALRKFCAEEMKKEDFRGEYTSGLRVARSKMFHTPYAPTPIKTELCVVEAFRAWAERESPPE